MPIEFQCPHCHEQVQTPDAAAGKKGKCPHCHSVVLIPRSAAGPSPADDAIEFPCEHCRELVRTPLSTAGKKGKCPHCFLVVQIPLASVPQLLARGIESSGPGEKQAKGTAAPPPKAVDDPFAALPANRPGQPGYSPGYASGYPSGGPPYGPPNPLGLPPAALAPKPPPSANPYESPFAPGAEIIAAAQAERRRGLPWELAPSFETFSDTLSEVLGSPDEAFAKMRRTGGVGNPMGFLILGLVFGQLATAVYATIYRAIYFSTLDREFPIELLVIFGAMQLIGGIIGAVFSGVFGSFISAAIFHLFLLMVGGAQRGYQATYRVVCFGVGSTATLNVIPVIGPLIAMFLILIVMIHGLTHAHEIPGSKAAFAVLVPLGGLFLCLCGAIFFLIVPAIAGIAGGFR
jgi:hypothetical protein